MVGHEIPFMTTLVPPGGNGSTVFCHLPSEKTSAYAALGDGGFETTTGAVPYVPTPAHQAVVGQEVAFNWILPNPAPRGLAIA
jgi:hypothetical protein